MFTSYYCLNDYSVGFLSSYYRAVSISKKKPFIISVEKLVCTDNVQTSQIG